MAESEELKSLLMQVKEESEEVGLKLNIQKMKIMASGPIISWEIDGKQWKKCQTLFWGAPKSLQMVIAAIKLKYTYSLKVMTDINSVKMQRYYFANKGQSSQGCGFSTGHVWM